MDARQFPNLTKTLIEKEQAQQETTSQKSRVEDDAITRRIIPFDRIEDPRRNQESMKFPINTLPRKYKVCIFVTIGILIISSCLSFGALAYISMKLPVKPDPMTQSFYTASIDALQGGQPVYMREGQPLKKPTTTTTRLIGCNPDLFCDYSGTITYSYDSTTDLYHVYSPYNSVLGTGYPNDSTVLPGSGCLWYSLPTPKFFSNPVCKNGDSLVLSETTMPPYSNQALLPQLQWDESNYQIDETCSTTDFCAHSKGGYFYAVPDYNSPTDQTLYKIMSSTTQISTTDTDTDTGVDDTGSTGGTGSDGLGPVNPAPTYFCYWGRSYAPRYYAFMSSCFY